MSNTWIRISKLNAWCICPRRFWIQEHEGFDFENEFILLGNQVHKSDDEHIQGWRNGVRIETRIWCYSHSRHVWGIIDHIEIGQSDIVVVERKHGKEALLGDIMQVGLQVMCLEEMGIYDMPIRGKIYLVGSHKRVDVNVDAMLRNKIDDTLAEIRRVLAASEIVPAESSHYCRSCSVSEYCGIGTKTRERFWKTLFDEEGIQSIWESSV